jgi:hypothetical protein
MAGKILDRNIRKTKVLDLENSAEIRAVAWSTTVFMIAGKHGEVTEKTQGQP